MHLQNRLRVISFGIQTMRETRIIIFVIACGFLATFDGVSHAVSVGKKQIGAAEVVIKDVYRAKKDDKIKKKAGVFKNNVIQTDAESRAGIKFVDGTKIAISEKSDLKIDDFIYKGEKTVTQSTLALARGALRFSSKFSKHKTKLKMPTGTLGIRGTTFDVLSDLNSSEIAVHEGAVDFTDKKGKRFAIKEGEALRVDELGDGVTYPEKLSEKMVTTMNSSIQDLHQKKFYIDGPKDLGKFKNLKTMDPDDVLVLETKYGNIYIQLIREKAALNAAKLDQHINEKVYDGNFQFRYQKGFVEIQPRKGTKVDLGKSIVAELSESVFNSGSVGMVRPPKDVDGARGRIFITYRDSNHLNGKYTKVGRVVKGLEIVETVAYYAKRKKKVILKAVKKNN